MVSLVVSTMSVAGEGGSAGLCSVCGSGPFWSVVGIVALPGMVWRVVLVVVVDPLCSLLRNSRR